MRPRLAVVVPAALVAGAALAAAGFVATPSLARAVAASAGLEGLVVRAPADVGRAGAGLAAALGLPLAWGAVALVVHRVRTGSAPGGGATAAYLALPACAALVAMAVRVALTVAMLRAAAGDALTPLVLYGDVVPGADGLGVGLVAGVLAWAVAGTRSRRG